MIEYFDKEEFMKAPIFATIEQETQYAVVGRDDRVRPWQSQEQGIVLHIGDRDYDVRDLVYRLLRAEGEVMALMEKVADLQTHVQVLEDKMSVREPEINYDTTVLDEYIRGVWKDIGN